MSRLLPQIKGIGPREKKIKKIIHILCNKRIDLRGPNPIVKQEVIENRPSVHNMAKGPHAPSHNKQILYRQANQ